MKNSILTFSFKLIGIVLIFLISCQKEENNKKETPIETSTVEDIDGNVYKTVKIGNQWWMAENLKAIHYRNGDLISTTTPPTLSVYSEISPKYQWAHNGNESIVDTYGRLYTWYAITDSRNVAPIGWHVAHDAEVTTLLTYLGGYSIAGNKLKEKGTEHWISPNTEATNETGFTALPGTSRSEDGSFGLIGHYGTWWSTTEVNTRSAWGFTMDDSDAGVYKTSHDKVDGLSVRCVKD